MCGTTAEICTSIGFSALQRAEIAEIVSANQIVRPFLSTVSVLFNEPKLLKLSVVAAAARFVQGFSALQRAEIAEIERKRIDHRLERVRFSALQRAEIAEMRVHALP